MVPVYDNINKSTRTAGVYLVIGTSIAVFALQRTAGGLLDFGFIPSQFGNRPYASLGRMVTATFLHADVFHLIGNMIFFFAFARSIEERVGTRIFLMIYPLLGISGFMLQWMWEPGSQIPVVGASAAISTLIGAYLTMFPRASFNCVIILGWIFKVFALPAWALIFYWIALQVLSAFLNLGDNTAYFAHIGGFILGIILGMAWTTIFESAHKTHEI